MLSIKWQIEFFWVMPKTKIWFDKQSWKVATGFAGVVTHDKGPAKAPVFKSCEEFLWRFPDPWLTANWLLLQCVPTSFIENLKPRKIRIFIFSKKKNDCQIEGRCKKNFRPFWLLDFLWNYYPKLVGTPCRSVSLIFWVHKSKSELLFISGNGGEETEVGIWIVMW